MLKNSTVYQPCGIDLEGPASGVDGRPQPQLVVERDDGGAEADVLRPRAPGEGVADVDLHRALGVDLGVEVCARLAQRRRLAPGGEDAGEPHVVVEGVEPEGDIRSRNVHPEARPEVHEDLGVQHVRAGRVVHLGRLVDRRRVVRRLDVQVRVEPPRADADAVVVIPLRDGGLRRRLGVRHRAPDQREEREDPGGAPRTPSQPLRSFQVQSPLQSGRSSSCVLPCKHTVAPGLGCRREGQDSARGMPSTRESGLRGAAGSWVARAAAGWSGPRGDRSGLLLPPSGSRRCGTRAGRCTARTRCGAGPPCSWRC